MARRPLDPDLYAEVVEEAKARFAVWPSAYASGWVVKTYKDRGGKYAGEARGQGAGLTRWFGEEWVDLSRPIHDEDGGLVGYEPCGRERGGDPTDYPKCRPLVEAMSMSPSQVRDAIRRKRRAETEAPARGTRARPPKRVPTYRSNPEILAIEQDLLDAIEHADTYGDRGWTLADFAVTSLGDVPLEQLHAVDDLSSWVDVDPSDYDGLSVGERIEKLAEFRGPGWAARAERWLREGVPPIVVIETPDEDGRMHEQIGDGRGRVNFALAMGLESLPVVSMRWKGKAGSNPELDIRTLTGVPTFTPTAGEEPWELTLAELDRYQGSGPSSSFSHIAPPNREPLPPIGTWRADPILRYVEQLQELPIESLGFTEDVNDRSIRQSVEAYIGYYEQGYEPLPASVVWNAPSQQLVTINRRRVLAAKLAGLRTVKAWVGGDKYEQVVERARAAGLPVAARANPELSVFEPEAVISGAEAAEIERDNDSRGKQRGHNMDAAHELVRGAGDYVLVRVPVGPEYLRADSDEPGYEDIGARRSAEYAQLPTEPPPIRLLFGERTRRLGLTSARVMNGNHRVRAARMQGRPTLLAMMPVKDFERWMDVLSTVLY